MAFVWFIELVKSVSANSSLSFISFDFSFKAALVFLSSPLYALNQLLKNESSSPILFKALLSVSGLYPSAIASYASLRAFK